MPNPLLEKIVPPIREEVLNEVEKRLSGFREEIVKEAIARLIEGLGSVPSKPGRVVRGPAEGDLRSRVISALKAGASSLDEISTRAGETQKSRVSRMLATLRTERVVRMTGMRKTARYHLAK